MIGMQMNADFQDAMNLKRFFLLLLGFLTKFTEFTRRWFRKQENECISYAKEGNPKRFRRMIADWRGDVNS
jgi:hypothetical protein